MHVVSSMLKGLGNSAFEVLGSQLKLLLRTVQHVEDTDLDAVVRCVD